jgi:hypothetical protein
MKQVINALYQRITNQMSQIAYVDLWNNQLETLQEEVPIAFPAIFIELEIAEFSNIAKGVQQAEDSLIRFYLADWKYEESYEGSPDQAEFLNYFDLIDQLQLTMNNWSDPNNAFSTLSRTSLTPDNNHQGVITYIIDYKTTIYDDAADDLQGTQQVQATQQINQGSGTGPSRSSRFILPNNR